MIASSLLCAATVAGVLAIGCGGHEVTRPTFAIVGDSIVHLVSCDHDRAPLRCPSSRTTTSGGALASVMADRWTVVVRAQPGTTIADMLTDASTIAAGPPRVMAENLGTNDALVANPNWHADFDRLLAIMQPARCMVLTTVSVEVDHANSRIADQINSAISAEQNAHPEVRVVDWNRAVREHNTEFSADGYHPTTTAGQKWLAEAYRSAADTCP